MMAKESLIAYSICHVLDDVNQTIHPIFESAWLTVAGLRLKNAISSPPVVGESCSTTGSPSRCHRRKVPANVSKLGVRSRVTFEFLSVNPCEGIMLPNPPKTVAGRSQ
jgi:hypothetical protein